MADWDPQDTHGLSHFSFVLITGENWSPGPTVPPGLPAAECPPGLSQGSGCHHTPPVFLLLPQASIWPNKAFFLNGEKTMCHYRGDSSDTTHVHMVVPLSSQLCFACLPSQTPVVDPPLETCLPPAKNALPLPGPLGALDSVAVRNGIIVPLCVLEPSGKRQLSQSLCFCRVQGTAAVCTDGGPRLLWGPALCQVQAVH